MPFMIKKWWWEPNIKPNKMLRNAVEKGLKIFSEYLKADGVEKGALQIIFQE
jgi:hypothetical protein